MKELAFLEYTFVFDPSETWPHLSQFEGALADFLSVHDMEAQIIKTVGGQVGRRLMLISRIKSPAERAIEPKEEKPLGKKISTMVKPEPRRTIRRSSSPFISRSALAEKRKRSTKAGEPNVGKVRRLSKLGFRPMEKDDDVY